MNWSPTAKLLPFFLIILSIALVSTFVAIGNNAGAAIVGGMCLGGLIFLRVDDLVEFSGFGLQAKLNKTIQEAELTIAEMQDLAVSLARPTIAEVAMHGQLMANTNFSYRNELVNSISSTLRSLKLDDERIFKALELWMHVNRSILLIEIRAHIIRSRPFPREKIDEAFKEKERTDLKSLRLHLEEWQIFDEDINMLIGDIEHLDKTGSVRRPEIISNNAQIHW